MQTTDFINELIEKTIARNNAPPPRLTRRQKKQRRSWQKHWRQQLVAFAGHHYTRGHSSQEIDWRLLVVKLEFLHDCPVVAVPRSLRFSLGKTIGGKKKETWQSFARTAMARSAIYSWYARPPMSVDSAPEEEAPAL